MNIYATEEHRVTAHGPRVFAFTNLVYVMWCSLQFVSLHFLLSVRILAYTRTHVSKAIGDMDFENTIIGDLYSESCLSNWSIPSYTYFRDSKRRPIPSLVSTACCCRKYHGIPSFSGTDVSRITGGPLEPPVTACSIFFESRHIYIHVYDTPVNTRYHNTTFGVKVLGNLLNLHGCLRHKILIL